jgi:hypothetical protein
MVEAQRICLVSHQYPVVGSVIQLYFTAKSESFETPATESFGGPLRPENFAVIDLAEFSAPEGWVFTPCETVSGVPFWGKRTPPAPPPITFRMNGQTAVYQVSGTTSAWTVTFEKLDPSSGRPELPGFPAEVPLFELPYENWYKNWDGQKAPAILTCAPRSAEAAAAVCNWARKNGYQVRARGAMHNWSPLTLPTTPIDRAKVLLVDLTKSLWEPTFLPASGGLPNRVKVGAGATMLQLLQFLEAQPGGKGAAPGYSFPHTPGPGGLTVGGVLAINGHGTAVRTLPHEDLPASYGSISNQVLAFTAICTDPSSPDPDEYRVRSFNRGEPDAKALLVSLGRTLIVDATLQVVDNYNLRCESRTDVPSATLFAAPTPAQPVPANSFADFLNRAGRIEVLWFPYGEKPPVSTPPFSMDPVHPWLHLWTMSPAQPRGSTAVAQPYNYPFADHPPELLLKMLPDLLKIPGSTPLFGYWAARTTADALKDDKSRDIWGPSKNTLLYIQGTTMRVTANGYAIHLKRSDVQQAVADLAPKFLSMLDDYAGRGQYPINSAVEIRVTGLDDPTEVGISPTPSSPVLSALGTDATDRQNGWDVALWFDVLTIPGTPHANEFYQDLERWIVERFSGSAGRTMPEWSKGWAYTADKGPWTDTGFLRHVRNLLTAGREAGENWEYLRTTLAKYDKSHLFSSPFLDELFQQA